MRFPTQGQFLELLACIFGGIVIGIIYDMTHFGNAIKPSKVFLVVLDIAFVCLATFAFVIVSYLTNYSDIRLYNLAGFLAGFFLERCTIQILVAKVVQAMYNYIKAVVKKLNVKLAAKRKLRAERRAVKQKAEAERLAVKKQEKAARLAGKQKARAESLADKEQERKKRRSAKARQNEEKNLNTAKKPKEKRNKHDRITV